MILVAWLSGARVARIGTAYRRAESRVGPLLLRPKRFQLDADAGIVFPLWVGSRRSPTHAQRHIKVRSSDQCFKRWARSAISRPLMTDVERRRSCADFPLQDACGPGLQSTHSARLDREVARVNAFTHRSRQRDVNPSFLLATLRITWRR
jgi:hypothetical protein